MQGRAPLVVGPHGEGVADVDDDGVGFGHDVDPFAVGADDLEPGDRVGEQRREDAVVGVRAHAHLLGERCRLARGALVAHEAKHVDGAIGARCEEARREVEGALDDRLDAGDERTQLVEVALDRRAEAGEVVGPDVVVHPDVERLEQVGWTGSTEAVGEALAALRRVPAVDVGSRSTQLELAFHRECEERIGGAAQLGGDHR